MDYKIKSALTIAVLVGLMVTVGVFINNLEGAITGAVVAPVCDCVEDADCDDGNECTVDICLYPDDCEASLCVNKEIESCVP